MPSSRAAATPQVAARRGQGDADTQGPAATALACDAVGVFDAAAVTGTLIGRGRRPELTASVRVADKPIRSVDAG